MKAHEFDQMITAVEALGWTVERRLDDPRPKLNLSRPVEGAMFRVVLASTDIMQGAVALKGTAFGYQGGALSAEQKKVFRELALWFKQWHGRLEWPAGGGMTSRKAEEEGAFSLKPAGEGQWMLTIRSNCLTRCRFCRKSLALEQSGPGAETPLETAVGLFEASAQEIGCRPGSSLVIGGDEPLSWGPVWAFLDWLKGWGAGEIRLQTVGWPLPDEGVVRLWEAGVRRADIPLYAASPGLHDAVVRWPGAFEQAVETVKSMTAQGMAVSLHSLALPEILDDLAALTVLAASLEPVSWTLFYPRALPHAPALSESFWPDLSVLRDALGSLNSDVLPQNTRLVIPPCAVPQNLLDQWAGASHDPAPAGFEPPCGGCGARTQCMGPGSGYGNRWPLATLQPLAGADRFRDL